MTPTFKKKKKKKMFNFVLGQFCSSCGIGCCTETSCWRKANTIHVCKEISLAENNEAPTTTRSGYLFCHLRPFLFYKIKFNWFHFWVAHSSFLNQVVQDVAMPDITLLVLCVHNFWSIKRQANQQLINSGRCQTFQLFKQYKYQCNIVSFAQFIT